MGAGLRAGTFCAYKSTSSARQGRRALPVFLERGLCKKSRIVATGTSYNGSTLIRFFAYARARHAVPLRTSAACYSAENPWIGEVYPKPSQKTPCLFRWTVCAGGASCPAEKHIGVFGEGCVEPLYAKRGSTQIPPFTLRTDPPVPPGRLLPFCLRYQWF